MMKRWIVSGIAVVALLAVTTGMAYAVGSGSDPATVPVTGQLSTAYDAMHDSPGMQAIHDHISPAAQAGCDAMHAQMDQMMGNSAMTGDSLTTGGSMADHHPSMER